MINGKAAEVTEELFQSLLSGYQIRLEKSIRGSVFSLIVFIYCITNVIVTVIQIEGDHI